MEEEIAENRIRRRAFEIKSKGLGIYTTERDATPASMPAQAVLFHCGAFQPLWQQAGLIQAGPRLRDGSGSV
jgi:hypothetical protein